MTAAAALIKGCLSKLNALNLILLLVQDYVWHTILLNLVINEP